MTIPETSYTKPTKQKEPFQPKRQPESLRREIAGIEQERDRNVAGLKEQLDFAKRRGLPTKELEEKLDRAPDVYNSSIDNLRAELKETEAYFADQEAERLAKQKEQAAEADQVLKANLRQAFIDAGGDPDAFEAKYPELRDAELVRRTQANAAKADAQTRQHVRNLFNG